MLWLVVLVLLIAGGCALWVARRLAASQIRSTAHAEAALESSRLKSEFVASVSHQLRTPLSTIIGYAEIIEEEAGADDPTLKKDVGHILTAARHLSRLVNNILDQSKIEAGKLALSLEPLDLSDVDNNPNLFLDDDYPSFSPQPQEPPPPRTPTGALVP
jgi:signal transduction histidine kinase